MRAVLRMTSGNIGHIIENLVSGKAGLEIVEADFGKVFLLEGRPLLFERCGRVFPTLLFEEFLTQAARVIVNMGAVSHICNGADVMAPGIVRYEGDFSKGDLVLVVDVTHGKPLLVGEALVDSTSGKNMARGVVIKNVHFVGDKIWVFLRESFKAAS